MNTYTNEFLDQMRQTTDSVADELVTSLFKSSEGKSALRFYMSGLHSNADLEKDELPEGMQKLISRVNTLPEWADKKSMLSASRFFARHSKLITQLLGLLSLPFCYAAADGARVLYLSEKIKNDPEKRLLDTAGFIWDVMAPDAFEKTGKGFAAILKVRLIHAAARFYTLQSGQWDAAWGQPVNQEDMAGTNLALSLIGIRGLRKLGISIEYKEQQSYIHLWNVISYLSGIQLSLLPQTGSELSRLEETIRMRQFKPSVHGIALTNSLIAYFQKLNLGSKQIKANLLPLMRYLLGAQAADILEIPAAALSPLDLTALKAINFFNDLKSSTDGAYQKERKNFDRLSKKVLSA